MKKSREDRATIKNLQLIEVLLKEIRRDYEAVVDLSENISIPSGLSGSGGSNGSSYNDPVAKNALDGRRAARRSSLKKLQKKVNEAANALQTASFHSQRIQTDTPQFW
tara:strand:+ start:973 stop:1296 length:324 start_codon:yes stop_codon:yes gene_type:complete